MQASSWVAWKMLASRFATGWQNLASTCSCHNTERFKSPSTRSAVQEDSWPVGKPCTLWKERSRHEMHREASLSGESCTRPSARKGMGAANCSP